MTMARQKRESGFKTNPDYKVTFEPSPRRVRVKLDGETIADSTNAHLLFETRHLPVYYFPRSDVRFNLMTETDHHTFCPYKGTASYWTIAVGDKVAENAVWGYPDPFDEVAAIKDFVAFSIGIAWTPGTKRMRRFSFIRATPISGSTCSTPSARCRSSSAAKW
jgi:uncharacterized protein (DUF427 family)